MYFGFYGTGKNKKTDINFEKRDYTQEGIRDIEGGGEYWKGIKKLEREKALLKYTPKNVKSKVKANGFEERLVLGTCPGGGMPIVAGYIDKGILWGHCECGITWWFAYKVKEKKKTKQRCHPTIMKLGSKSHPDVIKGTLRDITTEWGLEAKKLGQACPPNLNIGYCPSAGGEIIAQFTYGGKVYGLCTCGPVWWSASVKEKRKTKQTEDMSKTVFFVGEIPMCPNHREPLETSYLEISEGMGKGRCPVSRAEFDFKVDSQREEIDKFGNKVKGFVLSGGELNK